MCFGVGTGFGVQKCVLPRYLALFPFIHSHTSLSLELTLLLTTSFLRYCFAPANLKPLITAVMHAFKQLCRRKHGTGLVHNLQLIRTQPDSMDSHLSPLHELASSLRSASNKLNMHHFKKFMPWTGAPAPARTSCRPGCSPGHETGKQQLMTALAAGGGVAAAYVKRLCSTACGLHRTQAASHSSAGLLHGPGNTSHSASPAVTRCTGCLPTYSVSSVIAALG